MLFSAPALWRALILHTGSIEDAGIRFLIALPVAAVLLALVRAAARRADDQQAGRPERQRQRS